MRSIGKIITVFLLCAVWVLFPAGSAMAASDGELYLICQPNDKDVEQMSYDMYRIATLQDDDSYAVTSRFAGCAAGVSALAALGTDSVFTEAQSDATVDAFGSYINSRHLSPDSTETTVKMIPPGKVQEMAAASFTGLEDGLYLVSSDTVYREGNTVYTPGTFVLRIPFDNGSGTEFQRVVAFSKFTVSLYSATPEPTPTPPRRRPPDPDETPEPEASPSPSVSPSPLPTPDPPSPSPQVSQRPGDKVPLPPKPVAPTAVPTATLPQTGLIWWPVPLLAVLGMACAALGLILKKGRSRGLWLTLTIAGLALIAAGAVLLISNLGTEQAAGRASQELLAAMAERRPEDALGSPGETAAGEEALPLPAGEDPAPEGDLSVEDPAAMPTVLIEGHSCAGSLSIPMLGLELPVLSSWTGDELKTAPAVYSGSAQTMDLVLCGHNYRTHFGRLDDLTAGDVLYFRDAAGAVYTYQVAAKEVVGPDAVETVTDSPWDLTLFTCTLDGQSRFVLRCSRK